MIFLKLAFRKLKKIGIRYLLILILSWFSLMFLLQKTIQGYDTDKMSILLQDADRTKMELRVERDEVPDDLKMNQNGAGGKGVQLTKEEKENSKKTYYLNQFNLVASDKLGHFRELGDFRSKECIERHPSYPPNLPTLSIIVIFHNEALSTLMRTVTSCFYRTNQVLLKDIILTDDVSNRTDVTEELPKYIQGHFQGKVKIVRAPTRQGLIKARVFGSNYATGEALVFLDSHCECTEGWAEPILAEIARDYRTAVQPSIGQISSQTFSMHAFTEVKNVGKFDWSLLFKWRSIPDHDRKFITSKADSVRTATMAGGLFGISKRWWEYLGKYDPGFELWGGENLEISIKSWLCGGSVVITPCSIIGHVFRNKHPYHWYKEGPDNAFSVNAMRLAEVWLDEFKEVFYRQAPTQIRKLDIGDIRDRLELKRRLDCKPFRWFLENVVKDMYIPTLANIHAGILQVVYLGRKQCIDHFQQRSGNVNTYPCHYLHSQHIEYTTAKELRMLGQVCLEAISKDLQVTKRACSLNKNQLWDIPSFKSGPIIHIETQQCLTLQEGMQANVVLADCDSSNELQKWTFAKHLSREHS